MRYQSGQILGNYRLLKLLGTGGFSEVYLGEHIHLETKAAIKVLTAALTDHEIAQFREEARIIFKLEHPNIVRIYDFGFDTTIPYIIMSYATRGSLREHYLQSEKHSLKDILPYAKQAAMALQYAHDQKLVHRDVKPGNMLLGMNDELLLCDFGISVTAHNERSLVTQEMIGTIHYMAPEQIAGKPRPASDQYSLGVVVYEWLCGMRPFQGNTFEIMHKHLYAPPAPLRVYLPQITPTVEYVIMKALAKDPQQRFESIQAFANALERAYQLESHAATASLILPASSASSETQIHPSIYFEITKKDTPASPLVPPLIDEWPTMSMAATDKQEIQPEAKPAYLCAFCGAETRPGDNFCLNCGQRISPLQRQSQALEEVNGITLLSQKDRAPSREDWGASLLGSASAIMPTITPSSEHSGDMGATVLEEPQAPKDQVAIPDEFATLADISISPSMPVTPSSVLHDIPSTPPQQPSQDLSHIAIQWVETGNAHYRVKQFEPALASYEQALQIDSEHVAAYIGKCNALLRLGRHRDALVVCEYALAHGLENADVWIANGEALYKLRRYEHALVAYEHALIFAPRDAGVWATKGNMLRNLRRYQEALAAYEQVLSLNPNSTEVLALKGEMLYRLEQYEEALVAYEYASRFLPRRSAIWIAKGEILYKLQRYKEALDAYERARHLKPGDSSIASKCDMLQALVKHEAAGATPNRLPLAPIEHGASESAQPKEQRPLTPTHAIDNDVMKTIVDNENNEQHEYFDVFLSYAEVDAVWVERLAGQLQDKHNFHVWLDNWMLIPGQSPQQGRARGIDQAKCVVVCIGKQTSSAWSWFKQEIERALAKQSKDQTFRVIPILLPEARDINIDDFLELRNSVDFRNTDYAYAFYRLTCGINGIAPGRWPRPDASVINRKTNALANEMLEDLRDKQERGLLDGPILDELKRTVMIKVWFSQWPQPSEVEDNTDE